MPQTLYQGSVTMKLKQKINHKNWGEVLALDPFLNFLSIFSDTRV